MKLIHLLLLSLVICGLPTFVAAQDYKGQMAADIKGETHLADGIYKVSGKVVVHAGGRLAIDQGTVLLFDSAAVIEVKGSINIVGAENNFVVLKSTDPGKPGAGIRVAGFLPEPLIISHSKFYYLDEPVAFMNNWYRSEVQIDNCVFKACGRNAPVLDWRSFDDLRAPSFANITLRGNSFINNKGGIFIAAIQSPKSAFKIVSNLIAFNEYPGRSVNGMFTAPLFFTCNEVPDPAHFPVIDHNTVFDNYIYTQTRDSVHASVINVSIVGSKVKLDLGGNYFGDSSNLHALNSIDADASSAAKAPSIIIGNRVITPFGDANACFYRLWINGMDVEPFEALVRDFYPYRSIRMRFGSAIYPGADFSVKYFYLDRGKLNSIQVPVTPKFGESNLELSLDFGDFFNTLSPNGYLVVDGAYDFRKFDLPALNIGRKEFAERNNIDFNDIVDFSMRQMPVSSDTLRSRTNPAVDSAENRKPDSVVNEPVHKLRPGRLSVSMLAGGSAYYGDLSNSALPRSIRDFRPAFGICVGYSLTDRLSLQGRFNYLSVQGGDSVKWGHSMATGYSRNLSFRSRIIECSILGSYVLLRNESNGSLFSVHAGISGFSFNPTGEYRGKWYELRTIGTAGQTSNGANNKYAPYSFGLPIGLAFDKMIGRRLSVGLDLTLVRTFTDYLDDVAGGTDYPTRQAIEAANPGLGSIAWYLADPAGETGRRSGSSPGNKDWYGYLALKLTWYCVKHQTWKEH